MPPEFPKPKNCLQAVVHSECRELVARGAREPYTMDNLYESPQEHTYRGRGRDFENFCRKLNKEGKEITLWRFLFFIKKDYFKLVASFFISFSCDCTLPLVMESFLGWLNKDYFSLWTGCNLIFITLLLNVIRLSTVLNSCYYFQKVPILCKNAIEVSCKLGGFEPIYLYSLFNDNFFELNLLNIFRVF